MFDVTVDSVKKKKKKKKKKKGPGVLPCVISHHTPVYCHGVQLDGLMSECLAATADISVAPCEPLSLAHVRTHLSLHCKENSLGWPLPTLLILLDTKFPVFSCHTNECFSYVGTIIRLVAV